MQVVLRPLLALGGVMLIAACGSDPREKLLGNWEVHPQNVKGGGAPDARQLGMKVRILADGTFLLTGSRVFEGLAGVREVKGTYEFLDDHTIHVTMKTRAFDYEPTDYSINEVSRNELLLNAESHAVTLLRDD